MTAMRLLILGLVLLKPGISSRPVRLMPVRLMPDRLAPARLMPDPPEVRNTSWKALYPAIADTVTLRFSDDSSAILSPTGVPILQSTYRENGGLVIFHDVGGLNACHDFAGSYHVRIDGDTLALVIAEDPCDTRSGMMILKPWIRKR